MSKEIETKLQKILHLYTVGIVLLTLSSSTEDRLESVTWSVPVRSVPVKEHSRTLDAFLHCF